ncbi:MAG: hypothetical protein ACR2RE_25895 [Geminicoccaceae bacterium]
MSTAWFKNPLLRMMLIVGGLTFAFSGCHYHHGYFKGGYGYHGGGHHGGYKRGYHHKRHGFHRRHRHGGWRGRY